MHLDEDRSQDKRTGNEVFKRLHGVDWVTCHNLDDGMMCTFQGDGDHLKFDVHTFAQEHGDGPESTRIADHFTQLHFDQSQECRFLEPRGEDRQEVGWHVECESP